MVSSFIGILATLIFAGTVFGQSGCTSFGSDIGNGGTYFFELLSSAPFSFKGGFSECIAEDIMPVIQLPNGQSLTCTTISTGSQLYESVCPLSHAQMVSGTYTIVFNSPANGLAFGRAFNVVNFQVTSFVTQTPVITVTSTPIATSTTTISTTITDTSVLNASTVTLPAATSGVLTIQPKITITTTSTNVHTKKSVTQTISTSTITHTPHCTTPTRSMDVSKGKPSLMPSNSNKANSSTGATTAPTARGLSAAKLLRRALVKRDGPDGPLTTTITEFASNSIIFVPGPTSTITETNTEEFIITTTSTPVPQTVFSGTVPSTITKPTKTFTTTVHLKETSTQTVTKTQTAVVTITLSAKAC